MRWFLPLASLSLAFAPAAFGDVAVYIGTSTEQNSGGSGPVFQASKAIQVIDLATGKYRAVIFHGPVRNGDFTVSDEATYVITKTTDRRSHTSTSLSEAGTGSDANQSTQVSATLLQGRDASVTLKAGQSQWPRVLAGAGFDVVTAGVDADTHEATPAVVSKSAFFLTLDEARSRQANAAPDTLENLANSIAQSLAAVRPTGVPNLGGLLGGTIKLGSGGVTFGTGSGGLTLGGVVSTIGSALNLTGGSNLLLSGGTLNLTQNGNLLNNLITNVGTIVNGGTLTVGGGTPLFDGSTLTLTGNNTYNGTTTVSGGTLTLSGGTLSGSTTLVRQGSGALALGGVIHIDPGVTATIYGHEYNGGPTGITLTAPDGGAIGPDTALVATPNP